MVFIFDQFEPKLNFLSNFWCRTQYQILSKFNQ